MVNRIKRNIAFSLSLLNKNYIKYIILAITILELYFYFGFDYRTGYGMGIFFFLNDIYSALLQFLFFILVGVLITKSFSSNQNVLLRMKNKDDCFKKVFTNTLSIFFMLYLSIILISLLVFWIKCDFTIDGIQYLSYDLWGIIRNFIYIVFLGFIVIYFSIYSNSKNIIYCILCFIILCIYFSFMSHNEINLWFSSYLKNSLVEDIGIDIISYFLFMIIKLGFVIICLRITNAINSSFGNKSFNLEYLKYNFHNIIRKENLNNFFVYIMCMTLGIIFIGLDNPKMLLNVSSLNGEAYILILCSACMIVSFVQLILNIFLFDINNLSDFIFTRISRLEWFFYKFVLLAILTLILRSILYILTGFSKYSLYDTIIHLFIIFHCGIISLKGNIISYGALVVTILLIMFSEINNIIILILFIFICINMLNYLYFIKKRNVSS